MKMEKGGTDLRKLRLEDRKKIKITVAVLVILFVIISLYAYHITKKPDAENSENILTTIEVNADPAAYVGMEIKVGGVVIGTNTNDSLFFIMPADIYLGCNKNPHCGEEYSILMVICDSCIPGCPLPLFEHQVIVTGMVEKNPDGSYIFKGYSIKDIGPL